MRAAYERWRRLPLLFRLVVIVTVHSVLFFLVVPSAQGASGFIWVAVLVVLAAGNAILLVRDR